MAKSLNGRERSHDVILTPIIGYCVSLSPSFLNIEYRAWCEGTSLGVAPFTIDHLYWTGKKVDVDTLHRS